MARVIFNADDLGLSKGVNEGIVHCYKNGVVNSASLMTTTVHFEETIELIFDKQLENIGLHFNLTEGIPLLPNHKTLLNSDNQFQRKIHELGNLDLKEVYNELEAQLLKAVDAGVKINHLDSHHHIHMTAKLRKVFVKLSKEYNLPLRRFNNTARHPIKVWSFYQDTKVAKFFTKDFSADFYDDQATKDKLLFLLNNYKGRDLEVMCHPGFKDDENGIYNHQREEELQILCNDEVIQQVNAMR